MGPTPHLPQSAIARDEVLARLRAFAEGDADYRGGRTFSLVYWLGEEHARFLADAHALFASENALNPMAFRSLKRLETEVVGMTAALLHGGADACGTMTSGGTETCLLAVKTYRDRARARRRGLRPEVILPESAHVAFDKAAHCFGVRPVRAPLGRDFRADVRAVRRRVNRNTVAIVASAPCYPFGTVDDVEALGGIARRRGVPLHVDACLGGFLLPFLEKLGHPVPPFDFRVPGVSSVGADVHKYGYSAKGASVLVYRDMDLLAHQFFVAEDWPGGVFASPALLGTRSGGPVAAAWAAMHATGEDGYLRHAGIVMKTTRLLREGIAAIPGLAVLGDPPASVFAYASTDPALGVYAVGDALEKRGWHVDRQQRPESLHAMVMPRHAEVAERFLADLRASVAEVRAHPELSRAGSAAMYGMMAHVPLRGAIRGEVMRMMRAMYGPGGEVPSLAGGADGEGFATRAGRLYLALRERWLRRRR